MSVDCVFLHKTKSTIKGSSVRAQHFTGSVRRVYLGVASCLLGRVQHLQCGLCQGLSLIQHRHLLLAADDFRRCANSRHYQWLKVSGHLRHLRKTTFWRQFEYREDTVEDIKSTKTSVVIHFELTLCPCSDITLD